MFRFGFDEFLWAYLLIPALAVFIWYAANAKRRAIEQFGDSELMAKLTKTVSRRAQLLKSVLVVLTVALLLTALARPQFGTRLETLRREGQDVIVALDVSASMLAEDIAPNRLERAKLAVSSLIARLEGDRIGLVAFAGRAFVQSPLTVDYGAAQMFLNAMDPDLIPVPGTNLGEALDRSLRAFEGDQQQHRVLVLITDGEDHEGQIEANVERAVNDGVKIHTVGIGSTDGVPIPEFDAQGVRKGFKRDETGEVVLTRLDEATLQRIARQSGGVYYPASAGQNQMGLLAEEIADMDKRQLDAQQVTQFNEQYQLFLGLALALLLLELFVPERRRLKAAWTGRFQ